MDIWYLIEKKNLLFRNSCTLCQLRRWWLAKRWPANCCWIKLESRGEQFSSHRSESFRLKSNLDCDYSQIHGFKHKDKQSFISKVTRQVVTDGDLSKKLKIKALYYVAKHTSCSASLLFQRCERKTAACWDLKHILPITDYYNVSKAALSNIPFQIDCVFTSYNRHNLPKNCGEKGQTSFQCNPLKLSPRTHLFAWSYENNVTI